MSHTPGPWGLVDEEHAWIVTSPGGHEDDVIGEVYEAYDARAIAALPDLLESAEALIAEWERASPTIGSDLKEAIFSLHRAVKKARGTS